MSDEPGHKAMLYFLEVLMNSTGPLTISQLAGRFGSSNFTIEMRTAAGGNESGLKQFLLKYPSLFTIRGNMVSLCDGKDDDDAASTGSEATGLSSRRSLPDVSVEMDAVQFFQSQLAKHEEHWVPIKSLAGHLSQTTSEIRNIVGPQLDFHKWLLRHMHIFDVQGELVGLREGLAAVATPTTTRRIAFDLPDDDDYEPQSNAVAAPRTPPAQQRSVNKNGAMPLHRSHSFGDRSQLVPAASVRPRHDPPVTMTANEYKAVMHIKDLLEQRGPMEISSLLTLVSQAGDSVRTTAGTSRGALEAFLRKSAAIFSLSADAELVDLVKNAKLSVIITASRPHPVALPGGGAAPVGGRQGEGRGRQVNEGKGKIFHVAKLWGIIDLGDHEHVFFDRSIMRQPMDDLQKHFETGEVLCFSATPAHKSSRARWRATRVWREGDVGGGPSEPDHSGESGASEMADRGPAVRTLDSDCCIEDEVNEFLPRQDFSSPSHSPQLAPPAPSPVPAAKTFGDALLSGAGAVPIWNFRADEERGGGGKRASASVVPESYQMSASALNDLRFAPEFSAALLYGASPDSVNGQGSRGDMKSSATSAVASSTKQKKYTSVSCQTVSTGDIIATQLYQDS